MATRYVLLEQHGSSFLFHGVVEAEHGPTQAVRRYSENLPATEPTEQTFVAIPVRNFNVVPRHVVVAAPRVEVGEVDADQWLSDFTIVGEVLSAPAAAPVAREAETPAADIEEGE